MVCKRCVIESIRKKFEEMGIIFGWYVWWLWLKGVGLDGEWREMGELRECVSELVKER